MQKREAAALPTKTRRGLLEPRTDVVLVLAVAVAAVVSTAAATIDGKTFDLLPQAGAVCVREISQGQKQIYFAQPVRGMGEHIS
jgi:hypothetical protein